VAVERPVEEKGGRMSDSPAITLRVNGRQHTLVAGADFSPGASLAEVLRDRLGLSGVKVACDRGACGACTVVVDKRPVLSCMTLAAQVDGADVLTVEGLAEDDPLIVAFATQSQPGHGTAIQCGFCTPGMIMTAKALLLRIPRPTRGDVVEALGGNICRCGCYPGIIEAVVRAGELCEQARLGEAPACAPEQS
jgi:aerobic-type carbon monoxide dehydrogenase small subunit (CoxS/CutS family)